MYMYMQSRLHVHVHVVQLCLYLYSYSNNYMYICDTVYVHEGASVISVYIPLPQTMSPPTCCVSQ